MEFAVEIFAFAGLDGIDKIGIEVGNGSIKNLVVWVAMEKFVADGLDEVGLAEAGATIEEERVVTVARGVDDAFSGSVGDIVV